MVLITLQGGRLVLPDLYLTDSSEALLSGRKPPFRLVVRARHADGRRLAVKHAVSEPFVVATRRVRASHKVGAWLCQLAPVVDCQWVMQPDNTGLTGSGVIIKAGA